MASRHIPSYEREYEEQPAVEMTPVVEPQRTVEIIRKEIIGTLTLSDAGTVYPLRAAFQIAADYFAEHDDASGAAVEFSLWGRTFRASIDPGT